MNLKKIITITAVVLIGILMLYGLVILRQIFSSNTKFSENEVYVYVPTDSNYEEVKKIIAPYVENLDRFEMVANKRGYSDNVIPGRFLFKKGMNSYELVKTLRLNSAVKLAFNNQERIENLAGRVGSQIEADSLSLLTSFKDSIFLKENGFNEETVLVLFIPNTYEIYWNTTAEKFRDKMIKEYRNFWNKERVAKAQKQGLTPIEATILASIVHKESVKKDERPRIAGVYLNRLRTGMPLQADPTVIFAIKKKANDFDQVIKRVFYKDLTMAHPYNTYMNVGLPPGPIAMPDITAMEAVLDPEKNKFIYFCASVERFGYHEFAATLEEHNKNAKKYSDWINSQGVKR
ncbi:endolytic transglycosylase MltG [Flavobacterium sp. LS1P28]|uniref:endolytic transglycosylase MltG n=1 Tax=unclassified Flavobacterium TaxID=196869 RepID=UPI000F84B3C7|nr:MULTISPECIES: endolytic transglycosylase MltG [unclassified Flavobacterium]RTY83431.1 endolytic transglycosylase MltG [Flavobacterium sp. LS1P28]RTY83769.1 endolytic transglycosylase MltG [Flavobacterium sp. ZB4P23]RTY90276.1 endolytic transglycosylase MltG [Flavobacterium sp. GSN2]RTY91131.1 endolytic transglycosylase MltG [Flavobacterium sp. RSP46]